MLNQGNSLGARSIPPAFNWIVDPLVLNPFLYFDGSENVTTAGGAVSSWSQVIAGDRTLGQLTGDWQPDNASEKSIDFDGTEEDRLAFDVAVAQAGILICATSNGIFAYEVDADSVDEITALGWERGYFQDLDLFAMVLLPTTVTDTQIAGVIKYLERETGATKNPTGSLREYWRGRTDLVTPKLDSVDFSGITSSGTAFTYSWYGCSSLVEFPAIDLSGGNDFTFTWMYCSSLATFGDVIFSSDAANINFNYAWKGCTSLTSFSSNVDLSRGNTFYEAWRICSSLTSFPALDLSHGTNFQYSWYGCSSMTDFLATGLDSGTTFRLAWKDCSSLTSFPAISLAAGTDFYYAWCNCAAMTSFLATDMSAGTDFESAWQSCSSMTSFPALSLAAGTNFYYAWYNCAAMTSCPVTDLDSGTNFESAWRGCSSLTAFPAISLAAGTDFESTWRGCSAMTSFPANVFDSWSPASVTDNCFVNAWDNCTSLTATSVENILNSLATAAEPAPSSGVDITIDYDAGTGTPSIASAVATLKGLSPAWTITLNGVAQ